MVSTKKAILSYGKGKKNIKHSKFDMEHQNQYTADFGELQPVGLFETLPDDTWHLGENALTLVKPMTAPAFTRIHQNYYGFYVRNSQVWEHWHDYITNGASYNQVYGSNQQRKFLQNSWQIPSIPYNYLQFVSKIANGFAAPWFELVIEDSLLDEILNTIRTMGFNFSLPRSSCFCNFTDMILLAHALVRQNGGSLTFASNEFFDYLYNNRIAWSFFITYASQNYYSKLVFYSSYSQYLELCRLFFTRHSVSSVSFKDNLSVGSNSFDFLKFSSNSDVEFSNFHFVTFSNEFSNSLVSPLSIQKSSYDFQYNNLRNNLVTYDLSLNTNVDDASRNILYYNGINDDSGYSYILYSDLKSPFVGKRFILRYDNSFVTSGSDINCTIFPFYDFDINDVSNLSRLPWSLSFTISSPHNNYPTPSFFSDYIDLFDSVFDYLGPLGLRLIFTGQSLYTTDYLSSSSNFSFRSFIDFNSQGNLFGFSTHPLSFSSTTFDFLIDLDLPCLSVDSSSLLYGIFRYFYIDKYFFNLGFDSLSYLFYSCINSDKLLDSVGLPNLSLASRSFFSYAFEDCNSLPFFAYSKIWDEYFRNRVTSSPELDYSKTNGSIFLDSYRINFLKDNQFPNSGVDVNELTINSWIIPFCHRPQSGISDDIKVHSGLLNIMNKDCFYPITSFTDVFSLLTGYSLTQLVLRYSYNILNSSEVSLSYSEFSDLFADLFYLPSFYNGLLHLKYQNFNKDYFTSAMLDPMSGSDEVAIGDTVTSLRRAEIEQEMQEQVAMSRSVKEYYKRIFGNVPTLLDNTPIFLGSDHIDVNIGTVVQTSQTSDTSAQGTRSGLGGAHGSGKLVKKYCDDHGFIFILSSFTIESQYFERFDKLFEVKKSYLDYPTVNYANIGNESIKVKELDALSYPRYNLFGQTDFTSSQSVFSSPSLTVASSLDTSDSPNTLSIYYNLAFGSGRDLNSIFGYTPRYTSYKFKFDSVHGELKNSLKYWHSFRIFREQPFLSHYFVNWEFISNSDDFDRLFASSSDIESKFLVNLFLNGYVKRALPFVSTPKTTN